MRRVLLCSCIKPEGTMSSTQPEQTAAAEAESDERELDDAELEAVRGGGPGTKLNETSTPSTGISSGGPGGATPASYDSIESWAASQS